VLTVKIWKLRESPAVGLESRGEARELKEIGQRRIGKGKGK